MKRMKFKEFHKLLPSSLFGAIASNTRLATLESLKELITTDDASELELMYLVHSGNKEISNTCLYMLDEEVVEPAQISNTLADIILIKYGDNWNRMLQAFLKDYNPINNYDMLEHEEYNSKITNESNSKRYGFNTSSDSPVGDTDVDSTTSGDKKDNFRDLTRSGNIGVTTSQQMIESELELRKKSIIDIIYNDIDTMLCLKIY